MLNIPRATPEQREQCEKLYKLYQINHKTDYDGSTVKCECIIKKESGLFKERRNTQSKDHIMEQVAYELAQLLGVRCCKAVCRRTDMVKNPKIGIEKVYGAFSRFEVADLENVIHYSKIMQTTDMMADELLQRTITLCNGNINDFVKELYQYIIFDYIMGQMDRHLENISVYKIKRKHIWYPLYDNGLCCFSAYANDAAIQCLNNGFYNSRMGTDEDILEAIIYYRTVIWPGDLRQLIHYDRLSPEVIEKIILKADKYKQIGKERRQATVNFIYNQAIKIHKVNGGEIICM